jgi:hypothetical protein
MAEVLKTATSVNLSTFRDTSARGAPPKSGDGYSKVYCSTCLAGFRKFRQLVKEARQEIKVNKRKRVRILGTPTDLGFFIFSPLSTMMISEKVSGTMVSEKAPDANRATAEE